VLSCGRLVFMAKAARDNRQTRASEGCTREEGAREGFHSGRTLFGADDEQMVGLLVEVDAAPTSEAAERGLLVRIACTRHEPEPSYGRQSPVHVSSTCCTPTSPAVRRRCMQCKRILMGCATRPQTTTHSCDAEVVLMRRRSHDSTRCDAMRCDDARREAMRVGDSPSFCRPTSFSSITSVYLLGQLQWLTAAPTRMQPISAA
jgi:hypothetical protein